MNPDPNELLSGIAVVSGLVISLGALVAAYTQIRNWVRTPFEQLETAIAAHKEASAGQHRALNEQLSSLAREVAELKIHFDDKGGNLRGRIQGIETRLAQLEANGHAERQELRGLVTDLRPLLAGLRDAYEAR